MNQSAPGRRPRRFRHRRAEANMTSENENGRSLGRIVFMALGGFLIVAVANALPSARRHEDEIDDEPVVGDWDPGAPERQPVHVPTPPKRFWKTLALTMVFFAGASFVAVGG